jgi:hypothetical protein
MKGRTIVQKGEFGCFALGRIHDAAFEAAAIFRDKGCSFVRNSSYL